MSPVQGVSELICYPPVIGVQKLDSESVINFIGSSFGGRRCSHVSHDHSEIFHPLPVLGQLIRRRVRILRQLEGQLFRKCICDWSPGVSRLKQEKRTVSILFQSPLFFCQLFRLSKERVTVRHWIQCDTELFRLLIGLFQYSFFWLSGAEQGINKQFYSTTWDVEGSFMPCAERSGYSAWKWTQAPDKRVHISLRALLCALSRALQAHLQMSFLKS